jgi:hypothetical protein
MPGVKGPATSLWPRGREGETLVFGRSRLRWLGTLIQYAIVLAVGSAAFRAARAGQPLGWGGVVFAAFFLMLITRSEFSRYQVRVDEAARTLTRIWTSFPGTEASEAVAAADIEEIRFEQDEVSSVTLVMKDGRRIDLDSGRAAEPLQTLAREASRALGVPWVESKVE